MSTTLLKNEITRICQSCGACCAAFRVSFYWAEAEKFECESTLTEQISAFKSCMKGTNQTKPHCVSLEGQVGKTVRCGIYVNRPSACREVQIGDEKCTRARAKHRLPAINFSKKKSRDFNSRD